MAQRMIALDGFEGNVKVDKHSKTILQADFKISKNGSYQVHLDKGTTLFLTVDVSPCRKCQLLSLRQLDLTNQIASPGASGGANQLGAFRPPSFEPANSPPSHTPCADDVIHRGFEESVEVDPEKAQLVCSDSFQKNKANKKKK